MRTTERSDREGRGMCAARRTSRAPGVRSVYYVRRTCHNEGIWLLTEQR
jgi:hypothetical protein